MPARSTDLIPVVQKSYDLCAGLYAQVHRFPRVERGLLGRVILEDALQMLVALTVANRRSDKAETLREASGRLDALRITLRLGKRLGFVSNGGYEELSKDATEVGRMLGGWLKYETREAGAPEAPPAAIVPPPTRKRRTGGLRYTMRSPTIERYLRLKLDHPRAIVFVIVGAFCQSFFEDAVECGRLLRIAVRDLAAESESEKILTCGIPRVHLERYVTALAQAGREVYVE
ncbi:MAG: four helix bundle protein [Deltaproteobacteria bacterium]|nr:four helix bundle protein [Deltaproteobacteria bacterium]